MLCADTKARLIFFVDRRPVSLVTPEFLGWLAARLANEGTQALLAVWDNASWYIHRAVRSWLKTHNQRVKHAGGCRLVMCQLPHKRPWLHR